MKDKFRSGYLVCAMLVLCAAAAGQQKTVKTVPPVGTGAVDGKSLYVEFCAVCHGRDGKGDGPAAASLKSPVTDLTQLAKRSGGHFNDTRVMGVLNGESSAGPHGNRDMPVWGRAFSDMSSNLSVAQGRKHALVTYIESLQAK